MCFSGKPDGSLQLETKGAGKTWAKLSFKMTFLELFWQSGMCFKESYQEWRLESRNVGICEVIGESLSLTYHTHK